VRRISLIAAGAIVAAACLGAPPSPASAQSEDFATAESCKIGFYATRIPGTPNAVTIRLRSVPSPGATITAYGATTQWSAPIDRYATVPFRRGNAKEYGFIARAPGPIEAVLYQRADQACTSHAIVRDRNDYDAPDDIERPTLALTTAKALDPINCAQRYAPATTLIAAEPLTPPLAQNLGTSGVVQVLVSIDVFGHATNARILSSPSTLLNKPSIAAALQSTFRPEIFRCHTVPGDYVLSISYNGQ
jgi:Gram-negative bacterial TonB protein C-terminal